MLCLNIDIDLFTNSKVERLTEILGDGSEIHLLRLWCYIAKHYRKTGGRPDWTGDDLEAKTRWYGEKGKLAETFLELRLIHRWKNGFRVHDWKHHAAHLIAYEDKCKINSKNAKSGWQKRRNKLNGKELGAEGDAMRLALRKDGIRNAKTKQNKTTIYRDFFENEPTQAEVQDASFSPECGEIYSYWVDAKKKVGLKTVTPQEKPDAARIAAHILRGSFSMPDVKAAIDAVMRDEDMRAKYGLGGVLRNINSLVNQMESRVDEENPRFGARISDILKQAGQVQHVG